jgi:RNA recognition motif-containing protein
MKIYVGNLSKEVTDEQFKDLVTPFGVPQSVDVAKDRRTGEPRGFGFVQYATDEEGQAAIAGLDKKEVQGRALTVNEARPQKVRA